MKIRKQTISQTDWLIIILYALLVFVGWLNIYSVDYNDETNRIFDFQLRHGKQIIWICLSIIVAFAILIIDSRFYSFFAYIIYALFITLLILVIFLGKETHGAHSWFRIGGFLFQPSEFAKFATALAVSKHLSSKLFNMRNKKKLMQFWALVLLPALLIIAQNDLGTSLVYSVFFLVLFRFGLHYKYIIYFVFFLILFILSILINWKILLPVVCVIVFMIYYFGRKKRNIISIIGPVILVASFIISVNYIYNSILGSYQKHRINNILGIEFDPLGTGYNVNQSKIAIGSGGFSGKGFLLGTQTKYDFVPEQSTDFIFCTIGEEWGFIGSSLIIILFLALLTRIILVAERQHSNFSRIYGYCVSLILFFHFVINIGMTIGLVPVIGIPLPFVSYGGSSLLVFTILLFIFLRFDSEKYAVIV